MRSVFNGWLIEVSAGKPGPRFLAVDGNQDSWWTADRTLAHRFACESAAQRFIDTNVTGAVARHHQW